MEGITVTQECDGRVSFCSPPLMELIREIRTARVGDVVAVLAKNNDDESKEVIPLWLGRAHEEYLGTEVAGNTTRYIARRVR